MPHCPHCDIFYDDTNETQPCCGLCGHPHFCGCGGSSYGSASYTPSWRDPAHNDEIWIEEAEERMRADEAQRDTDDGSDASADDSSDDAEPFEPEDDLPF